MSGTVFTRQMGLNQGLGSTPSSEGIKLEGGTNFGAGGGGETFFWALEDGLGFWALEDGSGLWLLEDAP